MTGRTASSGRVRRALERAAAARARAGEAGATLVEYALIVGLVVVVSLAAIEWTTDASTDELEDRGSRVGAPDVDASGVTSVPSVPPPVGGGDDDPATPNPQVATLSAITGCQRTSGNVWLARFTLDVTNSSGQPIVGALISYELTIERGDGTEVVEPASVPAPSLEGGIVIITRNDLKDSGNPKDERITLTVTGVGGPGPITADALPAPVTVTKKEPPLCS